MSTPGSAARHARTPLTESLQVLAEGLADLVGFGVVSVSVADGDEMVIVAAAGRDHAVRMTEGSCSRPRR